ncbi:MAG TPA: hypothetical protein PK760_12225, partial [Flavobacteriales bacterium]|nr:hypothetical protein [Flavobacteriales bacterium]
NDAGEHVLLSAPEAPENLFQDYGTGQLVNGHAHITIDPIFSRNILVNEAHPLRVFIQLRGNCNGTYVTNESSTGFDVVELQNGTSNTSFHWTVIANRANQTLSDGTQWNFAEERFARTAGPQLQRSSEAQVSDTVAGSTAHPEAVILERKVLGMSAQDRAKMAMPKPVARQEVGTRP